MSDFVEWCVDLMNNREAGALEVVVFFLLWIGAFAAFTLYFYAVMITKGAALLLLPVALYVLYKNDTRSKLND